MDLNYDPRQLQEMNCDMLRQLGSVLRGLADELNRIADSSEETDLETLKRIADEIRVNRQTISRLTGIATDLDKLRVQLN